MHLSHYLKTYSYAEDPCHLCFSTKKASKVLLKKETYQALKKGKLSSSDEALLSKLGMVVHDREEEKQSVLDFYDMLNAKNSVLNIIVVLNLDCNFGCVYCFEGDMKGKLYMSNETADHLINFIKKRFTKDKKSLIIDFYGGEPLLSIGRIKSISQAMKSFVESRNAAYSFTLVTNGSLFKREVAEELILLGLKGIKITLDGPAEIHNQSRPFKSGAPSFDAIMRNIKETCDLVKIGIGGNFDSNNYEKFVSLLDYFEKEGLTPEKISEVKFDPVMKQPKGVASPNDYNGGCMSINEPWVSKASTLLREEILKRGYHTLTLVPMPCMTEVADSYVVNFDGVIYKCPALLGKEGFAAGDVRTGVNDYADTYKLGMWKNDECIECEYLPLCFGGCRYMTYMRNGSIDKVDCKKAYLDTTLETLIKQDIKYGLKADNR